MFSIIFALFVLIITILEYIELFFCKECKFLKVYLFICVILFIIVTCFILQFNI